jgi:hypoxanthine phosphoribosyltransferase
MAKLPPCTFVSWHTVQRLSRELAHTIRFSGFRPDIVVAIGRGGYVPARLVCDCLHMERMTGIKVEHYSATRKQAEVLIRYPLNTNLADLDVLVVDDVNDSGDTLEVVAAYLRGFSPRTLKTAVLHEKAVTRFRADYVGKHLKAWRWYVYPWAVVEDVTSFLRALQPPPAGAAEASRRLWEEHRIRVGEGVVREVMGFAVGEADRKQN